MWWTKAARTAAVVEVYGRIADPSAAHYDAFISYSHAADNGLAPALRNALQRFATPWRAMRWTNPTRLLRIFQDQASLSANPRLWPAIETALAESDWFVLFASPVAAQSPWVGKEVDFWCSNKSVDRLLIVQTHGDVVWDTGAEDFDWSRTTALPPRLRGMFKDEPRWIDARWARTSAQTTLKDPRFRELVAELAAPLRGLPKDELIGDDIRQARRLEILRNTALAMLSLLLAGATAAAWIAMRQRSLAEQRLATAQRSESKALAVRANAELEGDGPAATVRIALAGLPKDIASGDRPLVTDAEAALVNGLRQLRELRHFGEGQTSLVVAAAVSPDGRQLAIGFQDGSIQLLDVATGKLPRLLRAANASRTTTVSKDGNNVSVGEVYESVVLAAFSADGGSLITVDASATASIWDTATGRPLAVLRGIADVKLVFSSVTAAVSRDGRFVVLGGITEPDDNRAVLWDSVSGKVSVLRHPPDPADDRKVLRQVAFASFSVDGRSLVTASTDRSVWLWDVAEARPVKTLVGHTGPVVFAAFSADGRRLVTAAGVGTALLWDPASGELLATFKGRGDRINGAALSPDGLALVTAHEDGTAWLWDITGTQAPKVLSGHRGAVKSASFSGDGRTILTTSADGTARLWSAESASETAVLRGHGQAVDGGLFSPDGLHVFTRAHDAVRLWNATATGGGTPVRTAHDGEIRSVVFSGDDRSLVTAGWDHTAQVSDTQPGRTPTVFRHPVFDVASASLSPDGRRMLTVAGGTARVWDVAAAPKISSLTDPDGPVSVATFSADGLSVVTAGSGGVRSWPVAASGPARVFELQDHGVVAIYQRAFALSADGRFLIAHFSNNKNGEWDLATGKITWAFPDINIDRAAYSPDGRRIVTLDPSDDGIAQVWDKRSDKPFAVLRHPGFVKAAVFSPDGGSLATVTNDGLVRLWDVASQRVLETVGRHVDASAVAFSRDGRRIASAGYDLRIWSLMPERQDLIDIGCASVPWSLSAVQRERFGVAEEWCSEGVSQKLRAKVGTILSR